jgi:N utilization substance protein B
VAGKRRRARELALKVLFELDSVGHPPEQIFARLLEDRPLPADVEAFARHLVEGVLEHRDRLD